MLKNDTVFLSILEKIDFLVQRRYRRSSRHSGR